MRSDLLLVFSRNEHNIKLSLIRSSFRIHFFCELFLFGAVDRAEFLQSDDRGRVARLDFHVIFQGWFCCRCWSEFGLFWLPD